MDQGEASYFNCFRGCVAPAKNVESFGAYSNFWLTTIPRETVANKGVRHFVIAIGALEIAMRQLQEYERRGAPMKAPMSTWSTDYRAALRSYDRAIKLFRTQVADQHSPIQPRSFLIYCILQAVFESLQGNHEGFWKATHVGFEVLKHRIMQDQIPIAAPLDDEGIEEAEVLLSRMVAVTDLFNPNRDTRKASIAIAVPIRAPIPDGFTSELKTIRMFNAFYSRAIVWVIELAKSAAQGLTDPNRISEEITVVVSQLREWANRLETKTAQSTHFIDRARLQVHQIEAKFGAVFLLCFLHQCGWEIYTNHCLEMLVLARSMVQGLTENDETRSRMAQVLLSEKLMPLVNRIIENCRDYEVRQLGLEILTMITGFSAYTMSQFSSPMIIQQNVDNMDGEIEDDGEFEPKMRYKVVGYTWDAALDAFKVTLTRSIRGEDGTSVQRVLTARYGHLLSITPAAQGAGSTTFM
ncbi:hypothetical protein AB5N19_11658 [Seiridium cardinale]